jgi:signal transduction histidine kinase
LALTKQILEEHGGRIEISSEVGKGTLVRLQLPAGVPTA